MHFELLPVLDTIITLYQQPADMTRFKAYLSILEGGTKGGLSVPIGAFNPMAKQAYINKLHELTAINPEFILDNTLRQVNTQINDYYKADNSVLKVCFNLADDLKGGWTNRYTTDYSSKFKIAPLLSRGFCVPIFWVSEEFDEVIVKKRVLEYVYRTIYRSTHKQPETLEEHILQEEFVADSIGQIRSPRAVDLFYKQNRQTTELPSIINYLYGDAAAIELGYTPLDLTAYLEF